MNMDGWMDGWSVIYAKGYRLSFGYIFDSAFPSIALFLHSKNAVALFLLLSSHTSMACYCFCFLHRSAGGDSGRGVGLQRQSGSVPNPVPDTRLSGLLDYRSWYISPWHDTLTFKRKLKRWLKAHQTCKHE